MNGVAVARHLGRCAGCGELIEPGDSIRRVEGVGWCHTVQDDDDPDEVDCAAEMED